MMPPISARARTLVAQALLSEDLAPLLASAGSVGLQDDLCEAVVGLRVGEGTQLLVRRLLPQPPVPVVPGATGLADSLVLLALARVAAQRLAAHPPGEAAVVLAQLRVLSREAPDLLDEIALAAALSARQAPGSWVRSADALLAAHDALAALDPDPQPPPSAGTLSGVWSRLRGHRIGRPDGPLRVAIARGLAAG
jgi:hypothetical protein